MTRNADQTSRPLRKGFNASLLHRTFDGNQSRLHGIQEGHRLPAGAQMICRSTFWLKRDCGRSSAAGRGDGRLRQRGMGRRPRDGTDADGLTREVRSIQLRPCEHQSTEWHRLDQRAGLPHAAIIAPKGETGRRQVSTKASAPYGCQEWTGNVWGVVRKCGRPQPRPWPKPDAETRGHHSRRCL